MRRIQNADVPMRGVVRQESETDSNGHQIVLDALECGHRVLHRAGEKYVQCVACYDEEQMVRIQDAPRSGT